MTLWTLPLGEDTRIFPHLWLKSLLILESLAQKSLDPAWWELDLTWWVRPTWRWDLTWWERSAGRRQIARHFSPIVSRHCLPRHPQRLLLPQTYRWDCDFPSTSCSGPVLLETLKLAKLVAAQTSWKVEELVEVQRRGGSPGTGWKHEKRGGRGVVLEGWGWSSWEVGGSSSSFANFVSRFGSLSLCFANLVSRLRRPLLLPQ